MGVIRPDERAWLWQRDDGNFGVQFGDPSEAMLAADFLTFEEVVPASRLEGAVEALRKIRHKARLAERDPQGAMAASWVFGVADDALADLGRR